MGDDFAPPVRKDRSDAERRAATVEGRKRVPSAHRWVVPTTLTSGDLVVQTRLTVGAVDDRMEREADAVADEVMRHLDRWPGGPVASAAAQPIRRAVGVDAVGAEGGELSDDAHGEIRRAEGGGQPLAADTRTAMEGAFGADFGGIRVHTDSTADRLSRQLSATAFTTGADVFFRSGAYQPTTGAGARLLAHELAHTVQQGAAATTTPSRIQRSASAPDERGAATTTPSRIQRSTAVQTGSGPQLEHVPAPTAAVVGPATRIRRSSAVTAVSSLIDREPRATRIRRALAAGSMGPHGGPVDAGTTTRVRASTGQPLADGIRTQMEAACPPSVGDLARKPIRTPFSDDVRGRIRRRAATVRRMGDKDLKERGEAIKNLSATAPVQGVHLWQLEGSGGATLFLLGTVHAAVLAKLPNRGRLVEWLLDTKFDTVYAELAAPNLSLDRDSIRSAAKGLDNAQGAANQNARTRTQIQTHSKTLEDAGKLDEVYTTLAANGRPILGLETEQVRRDVREAYTKSSQQNDRERTYGDTAELAVKHFGLPASIEQTAEDRATELDAVQQQELMEGRPFPYFEDPEAARPYQEELLAKVPEERKQGGRRERRVKDLVADIVTSGNEKKLMGIHGEHLLQGIDVQDIEERNRLWASDVDPGRYKGQTVLWVVGVSHLGGLTIELGKLGWVARSFTPP
jgi:hypothetical protein